eukprot:jgi/Tetstr1/436024/TSEL_024903.t1
MRHRIRRSWRHWRNIGASAQVTSWIRDGVRVPFRYNRPPPRFNQGVSFNDATPAQLKFLTAELRRFTAAGAWEKPSCAWWVSRAFFVQKPGDNQWRFIIDLRVLNSFCARKKLRMETLMGVRHLTVKGAYMFSLDLQDGFYAMGIAPSDRDYFTVNIRGTLYRLCGLPMGWSLSPYYFTTFTMTFVKHLRSPTTPAAPGNVPRSRRWLRRGRWRGARILPYVDDSLMFASSEPEALELRQRVADLLDIMGLLRNPAKGLWEPVHVRPATPVGYPPLELQSLAGRAQYLFLSIPAARFYLRELHDVVGSKWGGRMCVTHQLRRDLRGWTAVPTRANGRPIHRPKETAYMHCDSSGYGWGAVLNGKLEARGFWGAADERQHITWKERKAVRLAVESFLSHLAGRRVLLHEDNRAVCSALAGLTSRSPTMVAELRKLWYLLDSNGVNIKARYIRSAANVWADRLSRHLDSDDWQLDPVMFAELEAMWGAHSVDRFASAMNAMLPRYNAAWLDPGCEAKLRQSGAAATVVAPRWEGKVWHQALTEMAVAERVPYLSAINGFYRDHGAEPVAQGDLISKVRKGLAASQVELDPLGVRTEVPARLITRTLRLAETLREELGPTWTRDQLPRILLFRAAMAVVAMYVFYARGKAGVVCQTGDLTVTVDVYCGQRGLPAARWAVTYDEPAASWTSATVTDCLQLVAHMLEEHPPPGFVWTSHSLRKGAATAAYAIGVVLQKIKHFGGWAQLFSIVLDYINPTALPCAASWQLFGWLTPWVGRQRQPAHPWAA